MNDNIQLPEGCEVFTMHFRSIPANQGSMSCLLTASSSDDEVFGGAAAGGKTEARRAHIRGIISAAYRQHDPSWNYNQWERDCRRLSRKPKASGGRRVSKNARKAHRATLEQRRMGKYLYTSLGRLQDWEKPARWISPLRLKVVQGLMWEQGFPAASIADSTAALVIAQRFMQADPRSFSPEAQEKFRRGGLSFLLNTPTSRSDP